MRLGFFICVLLLTPAAGLAAESKPAWQIDWEKTLEAAEKEGALTAYIFESGPLTPETVQAFERTCPKIKANQLKLKCCTPLYNL